MGTEPKIRFEKKTSTVAQLDRVSARKVKGCGFGPYVLPFSESRFGCRSLTTVDYHQNISDKYR